ncbi:hypothetical protein PAXINDRAFT_165899 [Paxillus involutus ATCC 200175]|nr:hypothetical protein PAXINDRAFT_165899 [Paxillus involutus ATCC 200175]
MGLRSYFQAQRRRCGHQWMVYMQNLLDCAEGGTNVRRPRRSIRIKHDVTNFAPPPHVRTDPPDPTGDKEIPGSDGIRPV